MPLDPIPPVISIINMSRYLIRQFLLKTEWVTAGNICYLLAGKREKKVYLPIATELNRMCRTKRREIRLKKLPHEFYTCYSLATNSRSTVNRQHVEHDIRLRNCLGKYFHTCGHGLIEYLSVRTFADAVLILNTGNLYFEFCSGHMGKKQLEEKIRRHYTGKGIFRVIFWMSTAEYAHWKDKNKIRYLEEKRLQMLFEITGVVLPDKPNRILGATYTGYLKDSQLFKIGKK